MSLQGHVLSRSQGTFASLSKKFRCVSENITLLSGLRVTRKMSCALIVRVRGSWLLWAPC